MSYDRWTWTLNNPGDFRPHWDPLTMHYMIYSLSVAQRALRTCRATPASASASA